MMPKLDTRPLHIKKQDYNNISPLSRAWGKRFKKTQIYHKKHIFCGAVSHKARPLQIENELRVGIKVDALTYLQTLKNKSPMKHLLPELPYALDALAPIMSADTLNYHYGKHLQTYLDNVNRMIEGTPFADMKLKDMITKAQGALYNNAAQAFNHIIFFKQLTPTPTTISPLLTQALVARFGSVDEFKSEFSNAAATLFGSGWVWLALDANNVLQIVPEPNAGNPITRNMRPLMCIDVWEHAYYLDYQNRRGDYIKNFWNLVNWDYIEKRMQDKNYQLYY